MLNPQLDILDSLAGIALEPVPVEWLGHDTELDDEIAGQVLRLEFAAFLSPQPQQRTFIAAHDDPRVGAADESPSPKISARGGHFVRGTRHEALPFSCSRISSAAERITARASAATSWNRLSRSCRLSSPPERCCAVSAMIALK